MDNLLEVTNLEKSYYTRKGEIKAIEDISFNVYKGDFISFVGNSGCGKSTLLNIIFGLDEKTNGTVKYQDELKIGYMLQEDALLPYLTTYENAIIGLKLLKINTKENTEYVKELLNKYGLKDFMNKYPSELSGGMKQRVALIRTLSTKPDLILLDEPFSSLDYQARLILSEDVYNIIKKENKTAIMITHDIAEAISLSNKVYVLSKRPSHIKKEYTIKINDATSPIKKRNTKEFMTYYEKIWRDLDNAI